MAYSALLVGIGLWIGRVVRSSGDFFVAGRGLGAGLIFSTVLAANIGAGSTVGATSLAYEEGLSAWWWNGSAGLGSLVLALWVGPRIWREAAREGYFTVGDLLAAHYGRAVSGLAAALIWIGTFSILSGQLIGIASVLYVVGGIPRVAGYALGALVTTAYFVAGGLLSSAWVNRVQLAVILAGFAIAAPWALASVGGWDAAATAEPRLADFWYSGGAGSGWTRLFMLGPAFIISPGLLQKAYGARSERALTVGVAANGIALLLFAFAPVALGLAARVQFPALADENDALPEILRGALPAWLGGLALAAVFSAEVSTADAVLFMLSTSASRDLYRGFVRPQATDTELLKVARFTAVLGGVVGVLLALVYGTVVRALEAFYALLVVTLFVPVIGALYARHVDRRQGLVSIAAGVAALLIVSYVTKGNGYGVLTPTVCGVVTSAIAFLGGRKASGGRRS